MEQLILPNYAIAYTGGKCEKYVENTTGQSGVWGAAVIPVPPYSYTGAWRENYNGWNHSGEQPPRGFRVPVFFSLGDNPEGHVAIWIGDGRIATTPKVGNHPTAYIYPSMQAMIDDYAKYNGGCTYLGWSEGIGKKQVVKGDTMEIDKDTSRILISSILGYTGIAGRPYALDGSNLGDSLIGRPLTLDLVKELFAGQTATEWRDSDKPTSITWINNELKGGEYVPYVLPQFFTKK